MPKDKVRKIIWHCAGGHDFEVDDELKRTLCPICGGSNLERVVKDKDQPDHGRPGRGSYLSWLWR